MKVPMQSNLNSILSSIRYLDALIFETPTLIGLVVFLPRLSAGAAVACFLAALGSFFVMASIFAMNDWADINLDLKNSVKRQNTFLERGIHPKQMIALAISLAAGGLIVFTALSRQLVVTAMLALAFGLAYSVPLRGVRGKSIPVFSSLLHFGGTL